jgi:methionyl-tRNA formyltransferase
MRVVFIGNVLFSQQMLEFILENNVFTIVGIVTKQNSSFNSDHRNLAPLAEKYSIPFRYVKDINEKHNYYWVSCFKPDLILCLGWSSLLKKEVLSIPPLGVIGYHPAAIPYNRGRHPIIWALILGLEKTASTFFSMVESADAGEIISQYEVEINSVDNAQTLYNKLVETSKNQILEISTAFSNNTVKYTVQNLNEGNEWRKRTEKDGMIDFRMSTSSIFNLIRALSSPYPNADVNYFDHTFKVNKARIGNFQERNIEPGKVLSIKENQIEVKTGDTSIWLEEHTINPLPEIGTYFK